MAARPDPALKGEILARAANGQRPKAIAAALGLAGPYVCHVVYVARRRGGPVPYFNGPNACRPPLVARTRVTLFDGETVDRLDAAAAKLRLSRQALVNALLKRASTMTAELLDGGGEAACPRR